MIVLDRMEDDWAVLDWDGLVFDFPRSLLPPDIIPGDVLTISVKIDRKLTRERKQKIRDLEGELFSLE